ncbi:MAG: right-handed parallel beta-helix repeat-containing protein, partial [Fibrella sp.]|nr:right-handed parallel beta-helix repeat-containing protein [Armatimonadota bacterium]
NNRISGVGRETLQGTGISVVDAQRMVIENNEITDTPSAGISFGYYNTGRALSVGNVVRNNYIHDVVTELDDQAGIYIYGTRFDLPPNPPGNTILVTGNLIVGARRGAYQDSNPIAGLYQDEGTRGVTLRGNVVRGCENTVHVNTWSTEPDKSVVQNIVDADPAVEAKAGVLSARWAPLVPLSKKPAPVFAPTRLLAHYPLAGNARPVAGKGVATLVGAPAFDPGEKWGGKPALRLGGAGQYVAVPAADLGEEFTVSLWARLDETGADQVLFGNAPGDKAPGFAVAVGKDGKLLVRDGNAGKRGHNGATYPAAFPFGRWNHVTPLMARYGQAARVYVNGVDVTRDDHVGSNSFPTDLPLAVGASVGGGGFARGHVADLRVYAGRLRPTQIAAQSAIRGAGRTGPVAGAKAGSPGPRNDAGIEWGATRRQGARSHAPVAPPRDRARSPARSGPSVSVARRATRGRGRADAGGNGVTRPQPAPAGSGCDVADSPRTALLRAGGTGGHAHFQRHPALATERRDAASDGGCLSRRAVRGAFAPVLGGGGTGGSGRRARRFLDTRLRRRARRRTSDGHDFFHSGGVG